jgi:hypothetical protein
MGMGTAFLNNTSPSPKVARRCLRLLRKGDRRKKKREATANMKVKNNCT